MRLQVQQIAKFSGHQGSVYALAKTGDDRFLFSVGSEGLIVKWNCETPGAPVPAGRVGSQVFSLCYHPENNLLLAGTMNGGISVVDPEKKKEVKNLICHSQSVYDIQLHKNRFYAASKDGTLSVWSEDLELLQVLPISEQALRDIAFHPSLPEAALGSSDWHIYVVNLPDLSVKKVLEGPGNSVFALDFTAGGELVAGSRDARMYAYEAGSYKPAQQVNAHWYTINDLLTEPEGLIITASRDKTIRFWNPMNFELLLSLSAGKEGGHQNSVNKLLWLPSQQLLASGSDDRTVMLWRVEY